MNAEQERYFTNNELSACAWREVRQRKRVYRRLADEGKMDKTTAALEIAMMTQIAVHFDQLTNPQLFTEENK
jgi:hypothetical protein